MKNARPQDKQFRSIRTDYWALRRKRYAEAIAVLERLTAVYGRDPYPLFLLSIACLFSDRFDLADKSMSRIRMTDPLYPPFVQLQAFMALKSASSLQDALTLYVTFLETFPADPMLNRGLSRIRSAKDFSTLQQNARLGDYVQIPKPKKAGTGGKIKGRHSRLFVVLVSTAIVMTVSVSIALVSVFIRDTDSDKNQASFSGDSPVDRIALGGSGYELISKVNIKSTKEFYYSADNLVSDFNEARRLIKREKYNQALLILNRIHNSNASFSAREKADFLIRYVLDVEDRDYEQVSVKDVTARPYLYRGVSLAWNGVVANLRNRKEGASFTLLVDFSRGHFNGVGDIYSPDRLDKIDNGDHVLVKGVFMDSLGTDRRLQVRASEVRSSGKK